MDGKCVITVDRPSSTYLPGEVVRGQVAYSTEAPDRVRAVCVVCKGEARTHRGAPAPLRPAPHLPLAPSGSSEEYFHSTLYVLGSGSADDRPLAVPPGLVSYPFSFTLPAALPASYAGRFGHVEYSLHAVVKRPVRHDEVTSLAFKVFVPFKFDGEAHRLAVELEARGAPACCCRLLGGLRLRVRLPRASFYVGQTVPVRVTCDNGTALRVRRVRLALVRRELYYSGAAAEPAAWWSRVAELEAGPVPPGAQWTWEELVIVPQVPTANLAGCKLMKLEFEFRVRCVMPLLPDVGCRAPVYIGQKDF